MWFVVKKVLNVAERVFFKILRKGTKNKVQGTKCCIALRTSYFVLRTYDPIPNSILQLQRRIPFSFIRVSLVKDSQVFIELFC